MSETIMDKLTFTPQTFWKMNVARIPTLFPALRIENPSGQITSDEVDFLVEKVVDEVWRSYASDESFNPQGINGRVEFDKLPTADRLERVQRALDMMETEQEIAKLASELK